MRYQVHWVSDAEAELASIWIRANDRDLDHKDSILHRPDS